MATVKAIIRKDKINSKGQTTIYIRYGHKQKSIDISTGLKVDFKAWNESKESVNSVRLINKTKINETLIKSLEKTDIALNAKIATIKSEIIEIVSNLKWKKIDPETTLIKDQYLKKNEDTTPSPSLNENAIDAFKNVIANTNKSDATKANYATAIYHLEKFEKHDNRTLKLSDINMNWYDRFTNFLFHEIKKPDGTKGLADNTVGTCIKNIKVFLTHLEKRGQEVPVKISDLKVVRLDTPIYFLTEDEVNLLENYNFKDLKLEKVRDVFVFNCYTGLRFSDLQRLSKHHIIDDVIEMRAYKNQKDIYVPLTPKSERILKKYDYNLPIISEQKYNKYLKDACKDAGITKQVEVIKTATGNKTYISAPKWQVITSHVAIKTFISLCGVKGISPKIVSEITGKSVEIILKHYYGIDKETIKTQMRRSFPL